MARDLLPTIPRLWVLASAALLAGSSAHYPATAQTVSLHESGVPEDQCTEFEWEGGAPPASIRIPVQINGETHWYQLDTGANATISYGSSARNWGWSPGSNFVHVKNLSVGGTVIPAAQIYVMSDFDPGPGKTTGTIGLDLLVGYVAVLDHPNRRFCLLRRADLSAEFWPKFSWTQAVIQAGKYMIDLKWNGRPLRNVIFDTGAGSYLMNVDEAQWRDLTGRANEAEATVRETGQAFGKPIPLAGAPLIGKLSVESVPIEGFTVYYRTDQPRYFKDSPVRASAMIGSAAFLNHIVVMDFGAGPRLDLSGTGPSFGLSEVIVKSGP